MYNPKTKKTTRKLRYNKKRTVKAKTTDKHIKSIVKKEIHRVAEDKKALPLESQVVVSTPVAVGTNPYTLQYSIIGINGIDTLITQGTGEGGRIGNKITPRHLTVQGFLIPVNTSLGAGSLINSIPMIARMVIYRAKDNLYPINYTVMTTTFNPWSTVFQNGNTTIAPNNTYYDIMYKINKDKYIVYKEKIFKVGNAISATFTANNNDFKMDNRYKLNLSKHLKKLVYDDANLSNTSHAMHCIIFFCPYDNSALTPSTNYLQTFYNVELDYEDL